MKNERKDIWIKVLFTIWTLLTMGVRYISKMEDPVVGDAERWHILYVVMLWIAVVAGVAVVVYNVLNLVRNDRWWSR